MLSFCHGIFFVNITQRVVPPFGISMLGAAELPLRNSRPVAGNLRATRRAAQKDRWAILPQRSRQFKISILTVPSKSEQAMHRLLRFFIGRRAHRRSSPELRPAFPGPQLIGCPCRRLFIVRTIDFNPLFQVKSYIFTSFTRLKYSFSF